MRELEDLLYCYVCNARITMALYRSSVVQLLYTYFKLFDIWVRNMIKRYFIITSSFGASIIVQRVIIQVQVEVISTQVYFCLFFVAQVF